MPSHSRTVQYMNNLKKTRIQTEQNEIKLNYERKNPCRTKNVDEIRLLWIISRSDTRWFSNTQNKTSKANKRLWILRRLKHLGANHEDLLEVYTKYIRCVLELAVPAILFHRASNYHYIRVSCNSLHWYQLSKAVPAKVRKQRIQKCSVQIILGDSLLIL